MLRIDDENPRSLRTVRRGRSRAVWREVTRAAVWMTEVRLEAEPHVETESDPNEKETHIQLNHCQAHTHTTRPLMTASEGTQGSKREELLHSISSEASHPLIFQQDHRAFHQDSD